MVQHPLASICIILCTPCIYCTCRVLLKFSTTCIRKCILLNIPDLHVCIVILHSHMHILANYDCICYEAGAVGSCTCIRLLLYSLMYNVYTVQL